jgi:predicted GIY-YIG superfamily endonuclease
VRHARYPIDGDPPVDEPEWVVISAVELRWAVHVLEAFTGARPVRTRLESIIADLKRAYEFGLGACPVCRESWHVETECPAFDEPEPTSPHVLYRLVLDDKGRVIYIGVTRNFPARMRVHRRNWSNLIGSVLTETYDTAEEMFEAEKLAIHDEAPPLNRAGVG